MDNGGENAAGALGDQNDGDQLNISDVFDAITLADPTFGAGAGVYVDAAASVADDAMAQPLHLDEPCVRIIEQPASKALRFRYECEGRSAGSIPGVNSTPENKTYPTIKIYGYSGPAAIVVSCVTKEHPYRPHPHNLVGREGCKKGVCTIPIRVTEETSEYQFKNLGIQCVKRRDIGDALLLREQLRIDPFRTGFGHKNHPQSIDLNAVRLCFHVFTPDDSGRMRRALPPVVSDVIFDKKAMSDLHIMRASHCSGTARGGTQLILLCEKVTREDTAVVFFEQDNNQVVWEEPAIIMVVHKQVAIAFETPPYRNPHTGEHVNVHFQLKRITDNARSNSLPFEYIPELPGTGRKPLPDLSIFAMLLGDKRTDTNNNNNKHDTDKTEIVEVVSSTTDTVSADVSEESGSATITDVNGNLPSADVDMVDTNEKSLNELLDQVAELDEIYSENRTRLENITSMSNESEDVEDFNDAGTYTSLQMAFKNPVPISEADPLSYEDVQVQTFRGPIVEFSPLKRDTDDERAPPLPPKRVRKAASTEPFNTSQTSVDSVLKPGRQLPVTRNPDTLKRDNRLTLAKSEPALPPVKKRSFFSRLFRRREKSPAPSVKSEGKKEKKSQPVGRSVSSVSGVRPSKFKSSVSHTSLKDNASGTGLSYADSITHISLHGDGDEKSTSQSSLRRPASLAPLPPTDGGTILVAESVLALDASAFKKLQDDLDLTEAEHYALYMAVAPHATVSEFDETSCYYSPVDGDRIKRRKMVNSMVQNYEHERLFSPDQKPIKSEPRDKASPHHVGSSPLHMYSPHSQYAEQNWGLENIQGGLAVLGPGVSRSPYAHELGWTQPVYSPLSPNPPNPHNPPSMHTLAQNLPLTMPMSPNNMQPMSPNMQPAMSNTLQPMSPNMQPAMSNTLQPMSPNMQPAMSNTLQPMSPNMQPMSNTVQPMSPNIQPMSTNMQPISPNMQVMSRSLAGCAGGAGSVGSAAGAAGAGRLSPCGTLHSLQHGAHAVHQPDYNQMGQQTPMEQQNSTSLSNLLLDQADGLMLNSSELSSLSSMLG